MNADEGKQVPGEQDADTAQPEVDSDRRAPPGGGSTEQSPPKPRKPPLDIKQIEELEDDAPGG